MPVIMDGKALAAQLMASLQDRVAALKARGVQPGLAVVLVGEDPASQIYVRNKERACQELSLHSETIRLPADTTQAALEAQIDRLNADHRIHGILVQLPLPAGLDEEAALARILPEKDVDGFHAVNAGKLMTGADGVIPCTPKEVEILHMLTSNVGQVFSREQILSRVWGYDYFGDTRTVDAHIKRIRQKLPQEGVPWALKTVYGVGYRFEVNA